MKKCLLLGVKIVLSGLNLLLDVEGQFEVFVDCCLLFLTRQLVHLFKALLVLLNQSLREAKLVGQVIDHLRVLVQLLHHCLPPLLEGSLQQCYFGFVLSLLTEQLGYLVSYVFVAIGFWLGRRLGSVGLFGVGGGSEGGHEVLKQEILVHALQGCLSLHSLLLCQPLLFCPLFFQQPLLSLLLFLFVGLTFKFTEIFICTRLLGFLETKIIPLSKALVTLTLLILSFLYLWSRLIEIAKFTKVVIGQLPLSFWLEIKLWLEDVISRYVLGLLSRSLSFLLGLSLRLFYIV